MQKTLKEAFINAKYEANISLANNIWQKIINRNKKIRLIKISTFSLFGVLSLVGIVPVFKTMSNEFAQSGFYEYFSLFFSGNEDISLYWKEVLMSTAESLPTLNIIYTLTLVFILFISLKYTARQILTDGRLTRNRTNLSY